MIVRRRLALCIILIVVAGLVTPVPVAGARSVDWETISRVDRGMRFAEPSCPTDRICWAIEGGRLMRTTDGARTWQDRSALIPADVDSLSDLSCPSANTCHALVDGPYRGDRVLTVHPDAAETHPLPVGVETIDCLDRRRCVGVSGGTAVLTNDSWASTRVVQLPVAGLLPQLDCVTGSSECWLGFDYAKNLLHSTDAGKTWTVVPGPAGQNAVLALSCPLVGTCFGVFSDNGEIGTRRVFRTTDGGARFRPVTDSLPDFLFDDSLACASATRCVATAMTDYFNGHLTAVATDDGQHWINQPLPAPAATRGLGAACAAPSLCVIVSGTVALASGSLAAGWRSQDLPGGYTDTPPLSMSCATPSDCVLTGLDLRGHPRAATSADGGVTWTTHLMPAAAGFVHDLDCPTARTCVGVGSLRTATSTTSTAVRTTNGGRSWTLGLVTSPRGLTLVSCPVATRCLASADHFSSPHLRRTVDGGRTWSTVPAPGKALSGLTCSSLRHCLVFTQRPGRDAVPWTTSDLGTTWQRHSVPRSEYVKTVVDVDCVDSSCLAVGDRPVERSGYEDHGVIMSSHDYGETWTVLDESFPYTVDSEPYRISCGTPSTCTVIDAETLETGRALRYTVDGGLTWLSAGLPVSTPSPTAVTCAQDRCWTAGVGDVGEQLIISAQL